MTVLQSLEFVNLPSRDRGNGHNTLHLFCQCISTNRNHLVLDIVFWALNWTQVEISRNVITLRTMANVLDKCSVRFSLSTIRPPNLVVVLSCSFSGSRFVTLAVLGLSLFLFDVLLCHVEIT